MPHRSVEDRSRALAEIETITWVLDNSIPVPGTGGRRFGVDALIGLVPVAGDIVSAAIGLFVVWRGARMGLPRIVVARMLANSALDLVVGGIPFIGDAFDLWFKSNSRNLRLIRRHVAEPNASTRDHWLVVGGLVLAVLAVVVLVGWLLVSLVSAIVGALS